MNRIIEVEANELFDADITYLSLVKRGANGVPFRVIKSEDPSMKNLDLAGMFVSKSAQKPALVAVAVPVGQGEQFKQPLIDAGFEVHAIKSDEGQGVDVISLVAAPDFEDVQVLKVNDEMAAMVSNAKKSFSSWPDTGSFATNIQKASFFPSAHIAADVMIETLYNAFYEGSADENHVAKVEEITTEFAAYIKKLAQEIPAEVFKLDGIKKSEIVADPKGVADAEVPAEKTEDTPEVDPVVKTDEPTENAVEKTDDKPTGDEPADVVKSDTNSILEGMKSLLSDALGGINDQIKGLTDRVDSVSEQVVKSDSKLAATEEKLTESVELAQKAAEAATGTLLGGADDTDALEEDPEERWLASKADLPSNVELV